MGALALLEVLDRDGQVRQSYPVLEWPLRIGRALDNDVILSDPEGDRQRQNQDGGAQAAHMFTILSR